MIPTGAGTERAASPQRPGRGLDVHLTGLDTIASRLRANINNLDSYNVRTQGDEPPTDPAQIDKAAPGDRPYEAQLNYWVEEISALLTALDHQVERTLKF